MQTAFSDGFPILLTSEDSLEGETNQTQAVRSPQNQLPPRSRLLDTLTLTLTPTLNRTLTLILITGADVGKRTQNP
eukprot:4998583-Pyramimonas_sp.AAC.1